MDGGRAGSERTTRCTVPLASHRDRALFPYEGACLGACAPTREKACLLRPMAPGHPVADDCLPTPAMNGRGRLCGSAPGVREIFPPDFRRPLGSLPATTALCQDRGDRARGPDPGPKFLIRLRATARPPFRYPPPRGRNIEARLLFHPPPSGPKRRISSYPNSISHFRGKVNPYVLRPSREGTRRRDRAPKVHPNSLESARPDAAIGGEAPFPPARMRYLARYPRRPLRIWEEITAGP